MTNTATIDIKLSRVEGLFESLDPSPFHERDLDPKAMDYIVGWALEYPSDARFVLRLHFPEAEAQRAQGAEIAAAISQNFAYWRESIERQRHELFRLGRIYAVVGITTLAACLGLVDLIPRVFGENPVTYVLEQGLWILGWVANWQPIGTFFYDWWPLYRKIRLYRRLEAAEVEIVAG